MYKFIHKRSTSLNPSLDVQLISLIKEKVFVLILKKNAINSQCQEKLQEYCEKLENMGLSDTILTFYSEMKDFCQNKNYEETCNNFKENIIKYCQEFKRRLKVVTTGRLDASNQCTMQNECILWEEACSEDFKKECNNLRSLCRQEKQNNLRTRFLLRAFSGNLKTNEDCEKVINEKCLIFMRRSDELMKFCLTPSHRCEGLVALERTKCIELKKDIEKFKNTEISKEICILFLKECHFHKSNCDTDFQNICRELEEKCGRKKKYIPSYLILDPLKKEITLMEEIEHEELFGDEIGKPKTKDIIYLLALILDNRFDACETSINECYGFCSSLSQLKDLYNNTEKKMSENKREICTDIKNKLKPRCQDLKLKLHGLSMSNVTDDKDSIVLGWSEQSAELDQRLCIDLVSECFYLQTLCTNIGIKMTSGCTNLKSACLKTRLFRKNYQLFQALLRGKLHNLEEANFFETCINELLKLCKEKINIENLILIGFCLQPWDTCYALERDIERQSRELRISLGWKRDFPNEENCKELQEKCETLGQDSRMNDLPCLTLKERCDHLKNAKELEDILLKKQVKKLNDLNICIGEVAKICNSISKRKKMGFALSCIQLNTTCQIITRDIKFKCNTLGKNMDFMKVLEKTKGENTDKGPECDLWEPYCDKYMSNCEKLVEDNGDGKCKKLKENCRSYRELQNKENEVMYELQGSLNEKDKCQSALDEHCLDWTETDNHAFKNFCNDSTGAKNDTARTELCQKLTERIKERCAELSTRLNTMATKIEKNVRHVEELNEIARKALESMKFALNKQKTHIDINNTTLIILYNANANIKINLEADTAYKNQSIYLRQKQTEMDVTDKEAETFSFAAEALEVYTEVEVECKSLLLECGFKEDCPEYKNSCEKIEEACNQLEPLKIKPSEKQTINQTIIETTTITETKLDGMQKTVTVEGQCVSIRTTDRWVTSTSTYTRTSTQTSIVTSTTTLTSQKQCKPIKCITKSREDTRVVELSEAVKMTNTLHKLGRVAAHEIEAKHIRRAQAAQKDGIEEEHIFALILKDDLEDQKCKEKLKGYCEELKKIDQNFNTHSKLKEICEDKNQGKCNQLKKNVGTKCTTFKAKLEGDVVKEISTLTYDDCKKNEQQCLFLEGACPKELTEKCNELRNKCYQKKRDGVAEEVLLRAVRGSIESDDDCKKKLKEVCLELSQESNELTKLCLDQEITCKKFVTKREEKCTSLEGIVKKALAEKDGLRGKCLSLLEKCYFHRGNCQGDKSECNKTSSQNCKEYIPDCDKLAEECQKQHIAYIPPGPPFDPTRPAASLAEDIGLEGLYRKAEEDGVVIGGQRVRDATALLAFWLKKKHEKDECEKILKEHCKDPHKHEALEGLCDKGKISENGTKKCEKLQEDIRKNCETLTPIILKNGLYVKPDGIVEWTKLPTFFSREECVRLESYCFYFGGSCPDGEKACMNVKAACYKKGLEARANNVLQEKMRGWLHGLNETWLKEFQKKLVEVCKELKEENGEIFLYDELFSLCLQPAKAARLLTYDLRMRMVFLREQLDKKRDFPGDKDCKELGRKCEELRYDSREIWWPCYTLEQQCERLGTTELLKTLLLSEQKDTLKNEANCNEYLKKKCSLWTRRGDGRFSLVCAFQNATCKLMVDDVQTRCEVFKKNTDKSDIIDFLKTNYTKMESLAGVCPFWHPYCDKYEPNCPDIFKKNELCINLKKYCEPFYTRKALEDALKVELRGKLGDKNECGPALERYCTVLKEVNNVSINSLCEDSTKGNAKKPEEVRNKLCEKLIAEVREQCRVLPAKLEQEEKDLKDESKIFKELKEKAEEAMKKSNLVLSVAKTGGDNAEGKDKNHAAVSGVKDTMKHVKVVRRGAKDVPVTELEARALDLAADVLARYVELRERCTQLNSDCGIKDDCDNIKDVCKGIGKTCGDLKPLDIKSQEIVTQNVTTTTTKTVGPGGETVEECKSIKTTDTWVTKTSTHTSTSTSTSTITSTVTLTSTRRCKPTKCTTGDEAGDVTPSGGLKMTGWSVMRGVFFWVVGQNLARGVARAVKRRDPGGKKDEIDEELILALILKKDNLEDKKCKEKLKGYCKNLKEADENFEKVDAKLKEICKNNGETKCTDLKTNLDKKHNNFKTKLQQSSGKQVLQLTEDDCSHQKECLFLEDAYPDDLKENCNKLRVNCYQKKRKEVAEKALLRALSGKLKEENSCKEKLKKVCLELSGESDELTEFCFDKEKTCQSLIAKEENVCKSLKGEVDNLLKNQNELETKCLPLLKKCYFYSTDCTGDGPKCKDLENSCQGKGVVYGRPGSDFEPTRPGLTLAEEIELQELYEEAARDGVYIGRPPTRDAAELLLLVSQSGVGSGAKEKCEDILKKKCKDLKEHKLLKGLCKSDNEASENGTKECAKLQEKETEGAKDLTTRLKDKYFAGTKPNTIIGWNYLPKFFTDKDCRTLESDCLYFGGQGGTDKPCDNLRAACYKKGLDAVANEAFQEKLRGSLQGSNGTWLENLQKEVAKVCKELKGLSDELFVLCMNPKNTALTLSTDLRMRAIYLLELLNERRDFPTRNDCKELEKKCKDLGPDSREIGWPCYTLNQNCRRLESAEQLEEELLKEKIEGLDDFNSCVEKLSKQCNTWSRRRDRFTLACLAQNVTCRIITKSVRSKCAALDGHMKAEEVVKNAKDDKKESLCSSWWPYCNKYMSSCRNLTANEDHTCKKLEEKCKSFIEQEELEVKAIDELKGHLKEKAECKAELDKYCAILKNATNKLNTLCTDSTGNNDENVRNKLCEKLIERVKKQCPKLEKKLIEAEKKLEERADEYEISRKAAEDALKKANLVLVTTRATNGSGNKAAAGPDAAKNAAQFRLVRRNVAAKITEDEIKAFDLVSQALSLYVELKEECQDLLKGCGFKEECEKCKDACNTIENKCNGLKPLEVTEHKVQIETKNITITIKETVGPGGEKTGDAEKCTSIQTTDVWVTHTSTHTSTSTSTSTTTSTVTLTSTRKCRPTKCTTEGEEAGEVKPSGALRMRGWGVKGVLLGMMISVMI
ncbi:hypothetical protein PMAC_003018 [Pneumocystis sp. 'macacae']|nr:hypothetical protein PMAC_003018 [Pneumocystis sp. 'macacae']